MFDGLPEMLERSNTGHCNAMHVAIDFLTVRRLLIVLVVSNFATLARKYGGFTLRLSQLEQKWHFRSFWLSNHISRQNHRPQLESGRTYIPGIVSVTRRLKIYFTLEISK